LELTRPDKLQAVSTRRWLPLVLAVTGLLAVAALASHGRPLTSSRGKGPTPVFFDYVFTTFAIVAVGIGILFILGLSARRWATPARQRSRYYPLQLLLMFVAATLIALAIAHARGFRLHHSSNQPGNPAAKPGRQLAPPQPSRAGRRNARLRWDEVAVVLALLAAAGIGAYTMRTKKPQKEWIYGSHEEIALALDESLDDLRSEPDVRRAIIAAYARMERALAAAGLPRRPSEAPFEYVPRALGALDASSGAVERLTDLFERAKFSHHEPDEAMRDDAIDALVAVRDELRRPVEPVA
jgi:Domain of unknown function (DUF4129)